MARNPLYPKQQSVSPYDRLQETLSKGIQQIAKTKQQNDLISYQREKDALDAKTKAEDELNEKETNWRKDFYNPILEAIAKGNFDEAEYYIGERGEGESSLYSMRFSSMVRPENQSFFKTEEELKSDIASAKEKSLSGESLTRSWLSRDKSIDKSAVYDQMLQAYSDGDMTQSEFDFAMKLGAKQPWFSSLGLSKTEIKGGPSRDAMQADIKSTIGIFNRYADDNFYTPTKGFEWAQSTYGAQGFSDMMSAEAKNRGVDMSTATKREKFQNEYLKNLWRTKKSSPAARFAMETMKVSALEGGSGDKSLFELYGEGVAPGQSSGQQFLVNTFFGLAIESDPELRGINDRGELLEKLNDSNTQARIIRIVEEYLGPYETWSDYMATLDKPNSKFRLRLLED